MCEKSMNRGARRTLKCPFQSPTDMKIVRCEDKRAHTPEANTFNEPETNDTLTFFFPLTYPCRFLSSLSRWMSKALKNVLPENQAYTVYTTYTTTINVYTIDYISSICCSLSSRCCLASMLYMCTTYICISFARCPMKQFLSSLENMMWRTWLTI